MTYEECLDYLYSKLPMFSRIGSAALKNNLDNTLKLCEFLDNPQSKFKSVHIAGTNGKGSVSHMIASIFQEAGYKTGLYTSPHLKDFRERIRINGKMIEEQEVLNLTLKLIPIIEEIEPSFFEATVAMAFNYFNENQVDIAIIETGLGGRLDSTNVITPEISIITNIGYDHMNILGDSLVQIASEKAGIIKKNVPIIIGRKNDETNNVFISKSIEMNSELTFSKDTYDSIINAITPETISVQLNDKENGEQFNIICDLPGIYQKENITTVATAFRILNKKGWKLDKDALLNGFKNTKSNTSLFGRWDVLNKNPMIVLDVAHNEDGITSLVRHLAQFKFNKIHFILGFSKDKDFKKILEMLPNDAMFYFTSAHSPRALEHSELLEIATNKKMKGESFDDVNTAIKSAIKKAGQNDLIIVSGSIYVVGDVDRELFC